MLRVSVLISLVGCGASTSDSGFDPTSTTSVTTPHGTTSCTVDAHTAIVLTEIEEAVLDVAFPGDLDGDGTPDVMFRRTSGVFVVSLSAGGSFEYEGADFVWGPGDVDGDGRDDLLLEQDDSIHLYRGGALEVAETDYYEDTWAAYSGYAMPTGRADVDGDGLHDPIYLGIGYQSELTVYSGADTIFYNGDWRMNAEMLFPGDLDGDGVNDVVTVHDDNGVQHGPVTQITGGPTTSLALSTSITSLDRPLGDVDGDGKADFSAFVAQQSTPTPVIVASSGAELRLPSEAGFEAVFTAGGDVDGDGVDDLITVWNAGDRFDVGITYGPVTAVWPPDAALDLPAGFSPTGAIDTNADVDGDAVGDLIIGGHSSVLVVSGASFLAPASATRAIDCDGEPAACVADVQPMGASPTVTGLPTLDQVSDIAAVPAAIEGQQTWDSFGAQTGLGDFDGDGTVDLLVTAYTQSTYAGQYVGALYAFFDAPALQTVSSSTADQVIEGEGASDYFGRALAVADFDGDGLSDAMVSGVGDTRLLRGTPTGLSCLADATSEVSGSDTIITATALDDLNADGLPELALTTAGAAYLFLSPHTSDRSIADADLVVGDMTPWAVEHVGDITGDGVPELAVSDLHAGGNDYGKIYFFDSDARGRLTVADAVATIDGGEEAGLYDNRMGYDILAVPDLDGDGLGEVLVASADDYGRDGQVDLFLGADLVGEVERGVASALTFAGNDDVGIGYTVFLADFDGDGRDDLLSCAKDEADCIVFEDWQGAGRVWAEWSYNELGWFSPTVGDVDGNGRADVVLGFMHEATQRGVTRIVYNP